MMSGSETQQNHFTKILVTAEVVLPSELPVCSGPGWGSGELPPLEWATHSADSGTLELEQRGELRDRRNCFRSVR